MSLPSYPSTTRNKFYITNILRRHVPQTGVMLETASGTGEHICFFCKEFPGLIWQPSDKSSELFWAIRERTCAENNVQKPILVDLTMKECQTSFENYTAVVNINMIPWRNHLSINIKYPKLKEQA